jgi:decaprenylphospho-beta-D-ribofuranose 2-oxidase
MALAGWGRVPTVTADLHRPERIAELTALLRRAPGPLVPRGGGRAYGDQALPDGGAAILTTRLDRMTAFDPETGLLEAEAGVTFRDLLRTFLPRGWMAPVSPGTGFATLGGAVANDVHGKNNEPTGSFGHHLRALELATPDGQHRWVSPDDDPELFHATIGGCGLTGVVTRIRLQLRSVPSDTVERDERRMPDLDSFLAALAGTRASHPYAVGWIDALARGRALGRGVLETATPHPTRVEAVPRRDRPVPFMLPRLALNRLTIAAFNHLYFHRVGPAGRRGLLPVERFLYPLDGLTDWHRLYGKPGFRQFQAVLPEAEVAAGMRRLLEAVAQAGAASFLAVIKALGGAGVGHLSFAMRGFTLALDLPERDGTADLARRLEKITRDHGGRIYLAKDATLSADGFRAMYPGLPRFREVLERIDPERRMASAMSQRLGMRGP